MSITGLAYEDYVELNIRGSSEDYDPIVYTVLIIISVALGAVAVFMYRKYSQVSKGAPSVKSQSVKRGQNIKEKKPR